MATINCSGCGLPRAASEADKPCPVCEAGVHDLPEGPRRTEMSFPTDGMPADISQLATAKGEVQRGHRPELIAGIVGVIVGVVLAVVVQSLIAKPEPVSQADSTSPIVTPVVPSPPANSVEPTPVAEPVSTPVVPPPMTPVVASLEVAPLPRESIDVPLPAGDTPHFVVDFNFPDGHIAFPSSVFYKPGMRIILRGRVRVLTVTSLDGGLLDASGLTAEKVTLAKINNATVKVNAPGGEVHISGPISNGSKVTVTAPGGEVSFKSPYGSKSTDPRIEGGSHIVAQAMKVIVLGLILGDKNRLELTLNNGGVFKATSIPEGTIVEYRKSNPGDSPPHIQIEQLDPKAVVRRVE